MNIIQKNNLLITTKKGKGKLPLFSGDVERLIPIYGRQMSLDMESGYWQILVHHASHTKLVFFSVNYKLTRKKITVEALSTASFSAMMAIIKAKLQEEAWMS